MKRITMLAFLSICAIGFGQNKSLDQREEAKSPTMNARTVALPAAYSNNSGTTVSEHAGVAAQGQRVADVSVPFTGIYYNNLAPNSIIYYNGPYWNVPGNPKLSMLESLALGMNTIGSQAKLVDGTSIADDVVFTNDVEITSIDLFAYQTGATVPSVTAVYVRIWAGDPSSGGTIVRGDLTTNIIGDVSYAGANRVTETDQGDTSRQIPKSNRTDGRSFANRWNLLGGIYF